MKPKQIIKLYISTFLLLILLSFAYLTPENSTSTPRSCLDNMKQIFDSLAKGYANTKNCYSLPQTFGLLLHITSIEATEKALSIIAQKPNKLYETLIDSLSKNLTIHKVLIAKGPGDNGSYRAIFPKDKSVYKCVFDSVSEFQHNGELWIIATERNDEEAFIMITKSEFKRYVLPVKTCQFKSLFMRTYPFDTSVFSPSADYISGTCWEARAKSKHINRLYKHLLVLKPKNIVKRIRKLEKIAHDSSFSSPIYDSIFQLIQYLDSVLYIRIDSAFKYSERYRKLLEKAAHDAIEKGYSCEDLNKWIAKFISPQMALAIARKYKVYGFCSMDNSPLRHLSQVSWLACESGNYGVFLKSFYLLFNDYVYRFADASYAWSRRTLPIQTIEQLMGDRSVAFLIGSCLAIDTIKGYSTCNYRRIGQAIKNSAYEGYLLNSFTALLQDDSLDPYNASLIMFSLLWYKNYFRHFDSSYVDTLNIGKIIPPSIEGIFKDLISD